MFVVGNLIRVLEVYGLSTVASCMGKVIRLSWKKESRNVRIHRHPGGGGGRYLISHTWRDSKGALPMTTSAELGRSFSTFETLPRRAQRWRRRSWR